MGRRAKKATREQTRRHNSRLVFKTIYDLGQVSRADIARQTQLTRTTVSAVVTGLMQQGLVEEIDGNQAIEDIQQEIEALIEG